MKKLLILLVLFANICFADDAPMYGTPDNPQINGQAYDAHKPFIEPNQGFAAPIARNAQEDNNNIPDKAPVKQIVVKQANNIKTDSLASDSKLEKVLRQAASEGKLSYVLDQAKKANVPAAVAVVPMVESNYNKKAVSPKGAGGAWQIMPGTANDYGLKADDRFDFNTSTNTAIQILNDLHKQFGNWPLAFAAYNCGSQCVINALKKNPNAKDINELSLPKETKEYVQKIVQLDQLIAGLDKVNNQKTN